VVFTHVLVPYVKYYLIPEVMIQQYNFSKPVKVAVVVENATWTTELRMLIDAAGLLFFSIVNPYNPYDYTAEIVYKSYPLPNATADDIAAELEAIRDRGTQLIFHVFSGEAGQIFAKEWGTRQIPSILIGFNALAQESSHWEITGGKCEYEAVLSTPPRVNVTEKTIPFWDSYVARWGHEPISTSFGAYDAVYTLAEAIEGAGTTDSDAVVAELEKTDRISTVGRFKFTTTHDVFVEPTKAVEFLPQPPPLPVEKCFRVTWLSSEYVTPLIVQWRFPGQRKVIFPFNRTYTTEFVIPEFPLPTILPIFMILSLITAVSVKFKKKK